MINNNLNISRYKTIRRGTTTTTTEAAQKSSTTTEAVVTTPKPRRELTSRRTTTTEATDIINNDTSESKDTIKTIKLETNETLTTPEPIVAPSNINETNLVSSTTAIPKETVTTPKDKVTSSTEAQTSAPASVTPQLLDPRPFSVITRKKPVAGQTETTTPSAKVSEQISSTPGVRQSGIKELYDVNNLSTENSLDDSHTRRNRVKQRGQSRFNLEQVNRNRIRSTEEVSESPKETEENNDQPKRIRNPNKNRFTPPPSTESSAEVEKSIRTFRPDVAAEISDLSSLTAADISIRQRGLASRGSAFSRRNRPRTPNATSTISSPIELENNSTTSQPHIRRFQRPISNGIRNTVDLHNDDQDNPVIKRNSFKNLNRRPIDNSNSTERSVKETNDKSQTEHATLKPFNRNRKVIRRFRPTPTPISSTSISDTVSSSTTEQNKVESARSSTTVQSVETSEKNLSNEINNATVYPEVSSSVEPSESAITKANSTSSNIIAIGDNEDDDHEDTLKSNEEGENIRLSESNIRENSDISSGVSNGNVIQDKGKAASKVDLGKHISEIKITGKSTTEANIIIRTRKIIRKLQPTTESSLSHNSSTTTPTPRKVIRRLRPTQTTLLSREDEVRDQEKDLQTNIKSKKPYFTRNKPHFGGKVTIQTNDEVPQEVSTESIKKSASSLNTRRRFSAYNRTTTSAPIKLEDKEETELKSVRARPSFSFRRTTTSTTTTTTTEASINTNSESSEQKENKIEEGTSSPDDFITLTTEEFGNSVTAEDNVEHSTLPDISDEIETSTNVDTLKLTSENSRSTTTVIPTPTTATSIANSVRRRNRPNQSGRINVRPTSTTSEPETSTFSIPADATTTESEEITRDDIAVSNNEIVTDKHEDSQMLSTHHEDNVMHYSVVEMPSSTVSDIYTTTELFVDEEISSITIEEEPSSETTSISTPDITSVGTESATQKTSAQTVSVPENHFYKLAKSRPKFAVPKHLSTEATPVKTEPEKRRGFRPSVSQSSRKPLRRGYYSRTSTTESLKLENTDDDDNYGTVKPIISKFRSTTVAARPQGLRYNKNLYDRSRFKPSEVKENKEDGEEDEDAETHENTGKDEEVETAENENTQEDDQSNDDELKDFEQEQEKKSFISESPHRYGTRPLEGTNKNELQHAHDQTSLYKDFAVNENRYKSTVSSTTSKADTKSVTKPARNFSLRRSTTPKTTQNLTDINIAAVNQRNKNLFSKTRKMNIPHPGPMSTVKQPTEEITVPSEQNIEITTEVVEIATESYSMDVPQTTEQQTTLHHIFAVTESMNDVNKTALPNITQEVLDVYNNKTLQKLIEISRIVEVNAKEDKVSNKSDTVESKTTLEAFPVLDRLGVINRVVEIKVVGGPNDTENEIFKNARPVGQNTIDDSGRSERKFEIFGDNKAAEYAHRNRISDSQKHLEIINSKSHVKTITPNPLFNDASTIALEGLFMTSSPQKPTHPQESESDELLHTQNSDVVNIRLLEQDSDADTQLRPDKNADFVPIRILKPDVEMKARVVEITSKPNAEMIKIAPIALQRIGIRDASQLGSDGQRTTVVFPVKTPHKGDVNTSR